MIDSAEIGESAAAWNARQKKRCRHKYALVLVASPGPGIKAERWCPECGAHYGPIYNRKQGWRGKRQWNAPGGPMAVAYINLCKEVDANTVTRKRTPAVPVPFCGPTGYDSDDH